MVTGDEGHIKFSFINSLLFQFISSNMKMFCNFMIFWIIVMIFMQQLNYILGMEMALNGFRLVEVLLDGRKSGERAFVCGISLSQR